MNESEKKQRLAAMAACGGICEACGKQLSQNSWQGAHRIANTKPNRTKWGAWIIDHPMNIAIVCSLGCNQLQHREQSGRMPASCETDCGKGTGKILKGKI